VKHVVYVHGLWMPGDESLVLGHRLGQEFGLSLYSFRYSTAFSSMKTTTERLAAFIDERKASAVHFVGHSLGGLIIHRFLERFSAQPPGRAVFLGTPCVASRAAQQAGRFAPVAHLMGPSVAEELLQPRERRWTHARELGIVAGTQPLGVGQLLAQFDEDNDGTVAVSETRMPGATDHISLPVSHLGMLMSARVAHETGLFLTQGRFSAPPAPA
jgi:pimeloyl-ACP methyl ester carboxylesterase